MKRRVQSLARNQFVRNVTILASGTAIAQFVAVLTTPLLTRLYQPAEFGLFAVLLSVLGPPVLIAGLRYELAIVLPDRDEDAAHIFCLSCLISAAMSLFWLAAVLIGAEPLAAAFGQPSIAPLMILIPVAIIFGGVHEAAAAWSTRRKDFRALSGSNIVRSLATVILQIGGGLIGGGARALFLGRILGSALGTLTLLGKLARHDAPIIRSALDLSGMIRQAKVHWRFAVYNMPATLLNTVTEAAPALLLAYYFDAAAAGLFYFCFRLLEMPKSLIAEAVRRVFYSEVADRSNRGDDLRPIFVKTTFSLFLIAIGPTLFVLALGPLLFPIVFGPEWARAGIYAQWLVVFWLTSFCNVPTTTLYYVLHLQGFALGVEVFSLVLRVTAIVVGAKLGDDLTAVAFYSLAGCIVNLGIIGWMFRHTRAATPALHAEGSA